MRPKRIYFVRRHPGIARENFTARWREHGRLAMHFMAQQGWRNVVRYVHCDSVDAPEVPGLSGEWDGMGIVLFRDAEARREHVAFAAARQALEADEDLAFAQRVNRSGLVALEQVLREGPCDDGFKLARVFSKPADLGEAAFQSAWGNEHVPRLHDAAGATLLRHVANWPLPPENGSAWGLECAVVEELWFASTADVAHTLQAEQDASPGTAAHSRLHPRFALLTRETVLYEALTPPR
jgi:hypothetical protein